MGKPLETLSSRLPLGRLRGRSLAEVRVRGHQALMKQVERLGWGPLVRPPSDRDLGAATAERKDRLVAAFEDPKATVHALRTRDPEHERQIVGAAERLLTGTFDLLGYQDLDFGDPIDWHYDPVHGKRAPRIHWSRIPYLDPDRVGDHKIIWELNRHQYFVTLGQAYWFTGDQAFARLFATQVSGWMDQNPPSIGINWLSSLEAAFRSIAWLWTLEFFRGAPSLTPELRRRIRSFLYLHGRHIETYLSTYFSPNTHLTGEALGLFYLGLLCPEMQPAARWREKGLGILEHQILEQVWNDGVYFEQSSYYQRYTADIYLHLVILADRHGIPVRTATRERLESVLDHLLYLERPDGRTPLIGDDDGGRVHFLSRADPNDFRSTLAVGAAIFDRPDYCFMARGAAPESLWLLGPGEQGPATSPPVAPPSKAFSDGGYFIMRDRWTEDADYLVVSCGDHGTGTGAHAHADALSIELVARGEAMLVDPGTYTYTAEPVWRDHFRSSAAHNTMSIAGRSSSVPNGPFKWARIARTTVHHWMSRPAFDYFDASHDGYANLDPPAILRRQILFIKGLGWVIIDSVASAAPVSASICLAPAPDVQTSMPERSTVVLEGCTARLLIRPFGAGAAVVPTEGWVSQVYGARQRVLAYTVQATLSADTEVVTIMISTREDGDRYTVDEVQATGGRAFRIVTPRSRYDICLAGDTGEVIMDGLRSEAAWTVLTRDESGTPSHLSAHRLQRLWVDDDLVYDAPTVSEYHVGRYDSGQWSVESVQAGQGV